MLKSEKGEKSPKYLQNFTKSWPGHLHHGHSLYAKYHDTSSSGIPDILLTRFHRFTRRKSAKGDNSAKYSQNFTKVNQVIYTLDTILVSYITILAQAVLQIFCSQGPLLVKCLSLRRGIIQSNIHRILWKVNQIIYIMYPNCMPDIMILAQAVLKIFCWQS